MTHRTLQIEFHDLWHVGSGRGRGAHLDAVIDRDELGLPYVPGRMLKGVLRDAAERAAEWCPPDNGQPALVGWLFGERPGNAAQDEARDLPAPGALLVSDARLPPELASWLGSEGGLQYRERLFREHFSTAIEHETGTARDGSLRGVEVVVPLTLEADIHIAAHADADDGFQTLQRVLPLVRALGAHRTRGFGRVSLAFKERS